MYLLPTDEDIAKLYCFIDPETRFLLAARDAINELTEESMPYFDEIEDDIISMQRDINGFKLSPHAIQSTIQIVEILILRAGPLKLKEMKNLKSSYLTNPTQNLFLVGMKFERVKI